jgi:hypothetical protein
VAVLTKYPGKSRKPKSDYSAVVTTTIYIYVSKCCALKRVPVFDTSVFSTFQTGSLFTTATPYVADLYM